jgi:PleD family two-component response regulator
MDEIIQQSIAGKRFGLMGFETPEGESILVALRAVRGIGHVIGAEPNLPGLNSFSPFDACFVNASATGVGAQLAPIRMLALSRKPAVVIGSFEHLASGFAEIADLNREFILRPWTAEELLLRTYRILKSIEIAETTAQSSSRNGPRRVVVADDDATAILMISTILKHFHFECLVARNGGEALDMARTKKPALVLLDVSMPQMDGFEALTALRGELATRNTPVILISAHRNEAEVVKGFSLGADDYVTKPFNSGELIARIGRALRAPREQ